MKQIFLLYMPFVLLIYSAEQFSAPNDSIANVRFEFGVRCQEVAKRCRKTNDKDCKFAVAQVREWLMIQALELDEKKLLLDCLNQLDKQNS